ncbi:ribonuclease N [Lentzea aerocolonigenes]|uniref:Ribonuclease N n=1 Tax=Lentzea aerocolonigenes TaxID=68170 RepID=A0A0F0HEK4_LENAE|nr:ribonuclease domain-containing protein [Lentzea aerocolonigenes]KJK52073.1 ribonuclease N [Lentzea aerocolonigenes]
MHTLQPHWTRRLLAALAIVAAVFSVTTVVAPAADAAVYNSCTQSRCSAARSANSTWASKGYPVTRTWYSWPNGQYNFAGGVFRNQEGQLPSGSYQEFDVYPRARGAARDAYRIIVNMNSRVVYFSPDHYSNFYKL